MHASRLAGLTVLAALTTHTMPASADADETSACPPAEDIGVIVGVRMAATEPTSMRGVSCSWTLATEEPDQDLHVDVSVEPVDEMADRVALLFGDSPTGVEEIADVGDRALWYDPMTLWVWNDAVGITVQVDSLWWPADEEPLDTLEVAVQIADLMDDAASSVAAPPASPAPTVPDAHPEDGCPSDAGVSSAAGVELTLVYDWSSDRPCRYGLAVPEVSRYVSVTILVEPADEFTDALSSEYLVPLDQLGDTLAEVDGVGDAAWWHDGERYEDGYSGGFLYAWNADVGVEVMVHPMVWPEEFDLLAVATAVAAFVLDGDMAPTPTNAP